MVTLPSCFACDAEQGALRLVLLPTQSLWSAPKCALGTGTKLGCASHGKGWEREFMSSCRTGTGFLRMACKAPESAESKKGLLSKVHSSLQDGGGRSSSTACERRGWREMLLHRSRPAPRAGRAVRQAAALTQVPSPGTSAESSASLWQAEERTDGRTLRSLGFATKRADREAQWGTFFVELAACFVAGDRCQHWDALFPYKEVPA